MSSLSSPTPLTENVVAARLGALGNPTRLALYRLLVQAGTDGMNVGDIQAHLAVPPSTLAHHITTLNKAGLIAQERQGREVISFAHYKAMNETVAFLTEACCQGVPRPAESA